MRDKIKDGHIMMHVPRIDDPIVLGEAAKEMSAELLRAEFRGPGDTIEAAAYRIQRKWGVDAKIVQQCWNRPPREMRVSRWMSLFKAYWNAFGAHAEAEFVGKRNDTTAHPVLVGLADFIAGRVPEHPRQ